MSNAADTAQTDSAAALPGLPPDWPTKATDTVVSAVAQVRAKTGDPAVRIAHYVVYGLVLVVLLAVVAVLLLVVGVRVVNNYMPAAAKGWGTHLTWGFFFTVIGLALWSRRPKVSTG